MNVINITLNNMTKSASYIPVHLVKGVARQTNGDCAARISEITHTNAVRIVITITALVG